MTYIDNLIEYVSDACQIKDLDHLAVDSMEDVVVSDACQIKDLDHAVFGADFTL